MKIFFLLFLLAPLNLDSQEVDASDILFLKIQELEGELASLRSELESQAYLIEKLLDEEYNVVQEEIGQDSLASGKFSEAKSLLKDLVQSGELTDFLTLPAYRSI